MSRTGRPVVIAIAAAASLAFASCGGNVIDDQKAEGAIEDNLEAGGDLKIRSVECPTDVDVERGATFSCEIVSSAGRRATAVLRIRNEDADVDFVSLKPHD